MEIVESTDHFLQTIYRVKDGISTIAICYNQKDAEIVKAALEEARKEDNRITW